MIKSNLGRYFKAVPFFALIVLVALGCSKDEKDAEEQPPAKKSEVSMDINGSSWSGGVNSVSGSGGIRQVLAIRASDTSLVQIFLPEDSTGTFGLDASSSFTVVYSNGMETWNDNISGSITVTTNADEEIEGTFDAVVSPFSGTDTLNLTNGKFYWDF